MSDRMTELEIKIAFLERHVTAQDKAMLELHEELARLRKEVTALRDTGDDEDDESSPADERPPHY